MYAGKKRDKVNPEEERLAMWTACRLSGMPLEPPCVCDELGSLFNKDAVIHALMGKSMPKSLPHISSLRHVFDIKLEPSKEANEGGSVKFVCPVTGVAMSGKGKFVIVWPKAGKKSAGIVLSERALKEVPEVVKESVGGEWESADVLPVNPSGKELDLLKDRVTAKREAERAEKMAKKAAKLGIAAVCNGENSINDNGKRLAQDTMHVRQAGNGADLSGAKKKAAAGLMPANADPEIWNSLFTSGKKEPSGKGNNDYMTRGVIKYVA